MWLFRGKPKYNKTVVTFPCKINLLLEAYVSRLLEEAGIPTFITAEPYLQILGSQTCAFYSAYVVPDEDIDRAAEVLDKAGFPPCIAGKEKCLVFEKGTTHPWPNHHWHTDGIYTEQPEREGELPSEGVRLYKQSRIFWNFPKPCLGAPTKDDPYYMLVTDERIDTREGAFGRQPDIGEYPVKMPVPAR